MHREFRRPRQTHDAGDVLRAGAALALVAAAHQQRLERRALAQKHGAHALGRVHLVSTDGQHVAADPLHVDGDLAGALDRVDVEPDAGLGGDLADLLHRLQNARLVVGQHYADQACLRANGAQNIHVVDQTVRSRRDKGGGNFALGEALGRGQDRRVLDGCGNEVVAGVEETEERGVVTLGAAGVEDDLRLMAAEELGHRGAGAVHGGVRRLAVLMNRGGVAEVLRPVGTHGFHHLGQEGRGGVGIHVDSGHRAILLLFHCTDSLAFRTHHGANR